MSDTETTTQHRSLARVFADFLGLTAAVQAADATQLESLQSQINDLKTEIDAHPEVDTTTSATAAAVLDNAATQPAATATATVPADSSASDAASSASAS